MAIATLDSHVRAAIKLQEQVDSAYLVFGKTSPWTDDSNPPDEDENTKKISEIVGYKKLSKFSLARKLGENEDEATVGYPVVTYQQEKWVLIPKNEAYVEDARWLYAEAELHPDEFPLGEYRQVGIQLGLVPNDGVTKQNLLPSEVKDTGILEFYENREPQNRTSSVYALEQFMVKV